MDDREDQLDGLRIRQLAALRRATHRSRSHALIAAWVCAVAGINCIFLALGYGRSHGVSMGLMAYVVLAIAGAWGTAAFLRRARQLHREAQQPSVDLPSAAPDFSTLGDGTDVLRKLENIE